MKIPTASFDLCRELYELTEWRYRANGDPWIPWRWLRRSNIELVGVHEDNQFYGAEDNEDGHYECWPAYDLGYLLRKLPRYIDVDLRLTIQPTNVDQWCASYDWLEKDCSRHNCFASIPEDAACKLAVKLCKAGIKF